MTTNQSNSVSQDGRLAEIIASYCQAIEAGERPDRGSIVAMHPEIAAELAQFFVDQDQFDRLLSPLRGERHSPTTWFHASSSVTSVGPVEHLPRNFGDYELVEEIARGGMGVVFKAKCLRLDRIVALKMILAGHLATPVDVHRFRIEAENAAKLDHPNIVPLLEVGEHGGQHYFTMRLLEGGSLAGLVARFAQKPAAAVHLVADVARAVHYAHQRGILHRDLKPANILLDHSGEPHVTDFGLAKRLVGEANSASSTAIVGTPSYMAPEQASGKKVLTTAIDVFSLGAILYELVTSRSPFRADTPFDTLLQVVQKEPERPGNLNPLIDCDLDTICLKCLAKQPESRYGSAEALADDLERWLAGEPIRARRISAGERLFKWARRSRAVATLAFVAAIALLACMAALVAGSVIVSREKRVTTRALEELRSIRAKERRVSYLQAIALADLELRTANARRVETLLSDCPADLRGLEWNYLARLCNGELRSLASPRDPGCVLVHPRDGRVFVGGSLVCGAGVVTAYDAALEGELKRLRNQDEGVIALAISPDGSRMVAISRDRRPKVFDSESGGVLAELNRDEGDVRSVAFSPDGNRIVSGGEDGSVRIWDAKTGGEFLSMRVSESTVWGVTFSPDGKRVASAASDGTVTLWGMPSGGRLRTLVGHRALVRSVAFSPDGRRLVSAAYDNTARVWDADTGSELATLVGHASFVTRAVFSPDGRRIATTGVDGTVRLWDAATSEQVLQLRGHSGSVWDAAFSRDGRYVASVGEDGTVKLWPGTPHGMPRLLDRTDRRIRRIEGSANGQVLAVLGEDGSLEVWDTETDRRLCVVAGSYVSGSRFALSRDGKFLAVKVDWQTVKVTRTVDGAIVRDIRSPVLAELAPALSYDGGFLAVAQADRHVTIWDIRLGRAVRRVELPQGKLLQLALGRSSGMLAAAIASIRDGPGRVLLWRRGSAPGPIEIAAGTRLALSPGGDLLAAFGDSSVVAVCNTKTGLREYELDGMAGPVRSVAFAGPERLLAGNDRGTVTIWDTRALREVLSFRDMTGPVDFLALSEGRAVLGVTSDGSARRWEVGPVTGRSGDRGCLVAIVSQEHEP